MERVIPVCFAEHHESGYPARTRVNAKADVTLAIATDFNTAGERLTRSAVLAHGKVYCPVSFADLQSSGDRWISVVKTVACMLNSVGNNVIELNVAGNGIYSFKPPVTQEVLDGRVQILLQDLLKSSDLRVRIAKVRSGGQTGIDEAAIKAAAAIGLSAEVLAPKGWLFRDINGRDIRDEDAFKGRFRVIAEEAKVTDPCPECGTQLRPQSGGGVACPAKGCGYWFCY